MTSFESFLRKEIDVREMNRRSIMALSCEIDQVQNRTVIGTQSAKTANIGKACLQAHRPMKKNIPTSPENFEAF